MGRARQHRAPGGRRTRRRITTGAAALAGVGALALGLWPAAPAGAAGQPRPQLVQSHVAAIAASTALARAASWTDIHVPYSQTTWFQGYRTDCSGFVSMAWALTSPSGSPLSLVTQTLPGVSQMIPFDQLLPGDALIFNSTADPQNGSHAELFGGWVDASHDYYYVYQESDGATVSIASFPPAPLDGTSQWYAYRYLGMVSNLPAIPTVPPAPPPAPGGVNRENATADAITVSWNASPSATGYQLLRNGSVVATTAATSATDTGLEPSTGYSYQVVALNGAGPSAPSHPTVIDTTPGAVAMAARPAGGYWVTTSDGRIFGFGGAATEGSMTGVKLDQPVVGMAATADGRGYWMDAGDGGIFAFGDAAFYGSMGGRPLDRPVVGMAPTGDGRGYWEVASDGGVFSFGDAPFYGSMGGRPLNRPVVSMAPTPDGRGYWMVASDGGIFSFGDAPFYGSMGGTPLNQPVVAMAATPDGRGYWLVASDGGIFAFGDARFMGSTGGTATGKVMEAIAATPDGAGYWLLAADGTIYDYGDAANDGSPAGHTL